MGILLLVVCVTSLSAQQQVGKSAVRPKPSSPAAPNSPPAQRPAAIQGAVKAAPMKIPRVDTKMDELEPVSAELLRVLEDWEQKSAQVKLIQGKHTRVVFNHVFELEKRSEGKFFLETPDKGRIDLVGVKPKKSEESKKIGKESGKPYRIDEDRHEMWICNGEEIVMVNGDEKTYEIAAIPEDLRGTNIVNGPLPFLFGMKSEEAQKRFQITLRQNNSTSAVLRVVPRLQSDRDNYKEAYVILDKKTYLPKAVKMIDPSGNLETEYWFEIQDVNNRSLKAKLAGMFGDADPFHPDLMNKGYKLSLPTDAGNAIHTAGAKQPAGQSAPRPTPNPSAVKLKK